MQYVSTRGSKKKVSALEAIAYGLAEDGGLYVPERFPSLGEDFNERLIDMSYQDIAVEILHAFIPEADRGILYEIAEKSASRFFENEPAPVFKINDDLFVLELWHGPTLAFKDIALTMLPHLMSLAKEKLKITTETLILTATSGDTGAAAMEGFRDIEGFKVITFFPDKNVSRIQKLQMQTAKGKNVFAVGINGNFDDAQRAVKRIFNDQRMRARLEKKNINLSSANSINLGRLLPQIIYYFSTYAMLLDSKQIGKGEQVNFSVPSGNFGDILAGFYAKRLGLPINRLICASNSNSVLADFLTDGEYNGDRELQKTISPSMDILFSSNLERLIFDAVLCDGERTKELYDSLSRDKKFKLKGEEFDRIKDVFYGDYCSDEETIEAIANLYESDDYITDPHTAVAFSCNANYIAETGDETKSIIISTASPYKFAPDVLSAIGERVSKNLGDALEQLCEMTALSIPDELVESLSGRIRFNELIEPSEAEDEVLKIAKA